MKCCPCYLLGVQVLPDGDPRVYILLTPCGLGLLLWPSREELLVPGVAAAAVEMRFEVIPLLCQQTASGFCPYCGPQDREGTNWQRSPRWEQLEG